MNNLSQECINEICRIFPVESLFAKDNHSKRQGASIAITNPTIYQSAGLMSVEEALRFAEWVGLRFEMYGQKEWYGTLGGTYTTTELLTIFRNQNK